MSNTENLLIELGTEELPPKTLKKLSDTFCTFLVAELKKLGFTYEHASAFGAPRRLGVLVSNCERVQADKQVEKRGPAVSVAFDAEGNATPAAIGWAKSNGIDITQAERLVTPKGEWLLHKATVAGQSLDAELQGALERALKQLPIPKPMRWGSSAAEFIRPVHTICVLYGSEIIDIELFGLQSGRQTSGHRFHGDHRVAIPKADDYVDVMRDQYVLVKYEERVNTIKTQLEEMASSLGLHADYDQNLLEEISSLVEWPVVLKATFENEFLAVPKEALIYTMKDDQKYVPLLNTDGSLSNTFLFVSNIESKDPSQVITGNEKVIRPRLSDARFFFEADKKTSLESKAKQLSTILFQKDLGTVAEKSARVADITQLIGKACKLDHTVLQNAHRAALLAKADLVSNMVMEFTSIQGTMGKHYANHDGENAAVALAIEEQYLPRFANDKLPSSMEGTLVSLAEKLDTLVGIFGINKIPKGDKDPFALRRSAIGILRILVDNKLDIDLSLLIDGVIATFSDKLKNPQTKEQVLAFLLDRCKPFYADLGVSSDLVNAVMAVTDSYSLSDINLRIQAVADFAKSQAGASLIAGNKRVSNILNKNNIELNEYSSINTELFEADEEAALFESFEDIQGLVSADTGSIDYADLLVKLSSLEAPLSNFFDKVMIMADDEKVKANRIAIVANVRLAFLSVADISLINV
ncbi:glycine--tRNA ligase subunit beta [Agaribacter flavus]|uniref:Glycine--tRNA ligase beta subunit n=1 Tax=Agaribacter flavus TaxID=1902781 RepID=A0ABV7FTI0_9ALTE